MQALARCHFDRRIMAAIYPDARRMITFFKKKNIPVVLLTGSNQILSQPVADELGVNALLSTAAEVLEGCFTGRIVGSYLSKKEKLNKALEFCEGQPASLTEAAFFADSINDLPLLECVGFPVLINPANNLLSVAKTHNWPVEHWTL